VHDINSYRNDSSASVTTFGLAINAGIFINDRDVFCELAGGPALRHVIDRSVLVNAVFGDTAPMPTQFYPPATFDAGAVPDNRARYRRSRWLPRTALQSAECRNSSHNRSSGGCVRKRCTMMAMC
jgi:hypothetical protein